MNTLFLKTSIFILVMGFVWMTQLNTQTDQIKESSASHENGELRIPYENQLIEVEKKLQILTAQIEGENTINADQYRRYQSTLNRLIQDTTTISRQTEPTDLTDQFDQLVTVQKTLQEIDVK
ncbi:hypothetical protein [Planococcus donghaensis]|uniref:Uncharacterized protein n=1 Tax=Planococcus donghaensis TaxID=414778 RepID=A0A1C7EFY0_9BACL|nr:hypothetical protein [Planococcus donghaensis]ANU22581.1 hypothetical protein BCM40_04070 [Planococcus donghaensis]